MRRALTTAAAAITVLLLGSSAGAVAVAASAGTASTQTGTSHIVRFNVSKTHSPKLEQQLAARPAVAPRAAARLRLSALSSATPPPPSVEGIDVASFQHPKSAQYPNGAPIDWTQVAGFGYKFAFIKATEGSYYTNPWYASDTSLAQSSGLLTAPYAFAIPNYSGGALQADYVLDRTNYAADGHTLPLILDIEYDPYAGIPPPNGDGTTGVCYGLSQSQMVAWISAFVKEATRRIGQPPVIYTTAGWWTTCTGNSAAFTADPLWVASYATTPTVPSPWAGAWTYWQYTNAAQPPGISTSVSTDASWLSTTAIELAAPANRSDPVGGSVSGQINALDGGGAISFSPSGLPTGTSMNTSTGALTGTLPATAATFPVKVTASATGDTPVTQTFRWDVHGTVSLGALSSQTGSVGSPVRYQVPASDGLTGCTLTFSATGLPPGLTMNGCGLITGWPVTGGHYTVNVQATDSSGTALATGSFAWTVARAAAGPAGHIVLHSNGKCLAALSATSIAIETCGSASNQHWTVNADGSLQVNGSCLAAKTVTSPPAGLDLTSCTSAQRWQARTNAVLVNQTDGWCLADTGTKNGALAVAAACVAKLNNTGSASTPATSQQWILPAGPLTSGIPGSCASNVRSTGQQTGAVTLRSCNGTSAQAWTLEPNGQLNLGGQCLGLTAGATTPGTRVRLGACSTTPSQVWQLSGGPIGVEIVNPFAGLCLADPGDSATAGTLLVIGPCVAGDPGILWRVS
jgi:GH25 family lysozyme M1 (1,4-beta-N-acetylmuramidase)